MASRLLILALAALAISCSGERQPPTAIPPAEVKIYQHSIPAFGGDLLGSNNGEWGGELVFRPSAGKSTPLINTNVAGLYRMPFGYIALTGLAHRTINEGNILLVSQRSSSQLRVDHLMRLPFAPVGSRQRSDQSVDMVLFTGRFSGEGMASKPIYQCVKFTTDKELAAVTCLGDINIAP